MQASLNTHCSVSADPQAVDPAVGGGWQNLSLDHRQDHREHLDAGELPGRRDCGQQAADGDGDGGGAEEAPLHHHHHHHHRLTTVRV